MRVAEVQGDRIDLGRGGSLLVRGEIDRVLDLRRIERELVREAFADADRVDRRPRLGLAQTQRAVLGRQRRRRLEPVVHSVRIGLQPAARVVVHRLPACERRAAQTERARLDVVRERGPADEFGERAADSAAGEIHLEEARLGLRIALQERGVVIGGRGDRRHAEIVVDQGARRGHARRGDRVGQCFGAEKGKSGESKKYRMRENAPYVRCRHIPSDCERFIGIERTFDTEYAPRLSLREAA